MKKLLPLGFALACLLSPVVAGAYVAQTIAVDGHNDFLPANLIKDDRNDTQPGCTPVGLPLDIGRAYITNDATFVYFGVELAPCYCEVDLGVAIDVNTPGGGTTDPFARKIGWLNVPYKPDFVVYDVTPATGCNLFNYEALYADSAGTWLNKSGVVNPSYGQGSNGLGIIDSTGFREFKLPLAALGVSAGTPLHIEMWTTQTGATKGPLDALMSDDVQMSHPSTTSWDTVNVVQMTQMFTYTVLSAIDSIPPTVANVSTAANGFALQSNGQFALLTNKIDVTFSEPVDQATAETKTNYTYAGPVVKTISGALRDAVAPQLVHLTLNSPITANAAPYSITVANVKDASPNANVIVANGATNVGSFYLQNVTFNGDFRLGLCNGSFAVSDTFAIEGGTNPLTWTLRDNALMTDANADSIYNTTVPFCIPHVPGAIQDTLWLPWKFSHQGNFEPLGSNRSYPIAAANGATASVSAAWNDENPANFTSHAIDVIFQVNAVRFNPGPSDVVTLLGTSLPLSFTLPGLVMRDDGVAPDLVAGDKIYTARVTYPSCTPKGAEWKVAYNGVIECAGGGQGNRTFKLDDALYSQAAPLTLPARGIDRCTVTDKPVTVVFKVDISAINPAPGVLDTVAVKGDGSHLSWGWPPLADAIMADDGLGYDTRAHDGWFTKAVALPDSTPMTLGFKYSYKMAGWTADSVECLGYGNRSVFIDDQVHSAGSPLIRLLNVFNYCSDPTGVAGGTVTTFTGTAFGALRPVMPNPVARRASFSFELYRGGRVTLSVYDVTGRRVARPVNGVLAAGVHSVVWEGLSDTGLRLASGVYMYEVAMGGERLSRRMILVH